MEHMDVNPMGLDGFEFCEFTAPDTAALRRQFEALGFVVNERHPAGTVDRYVGYTPRACPARLELLDDKAVDLQEALLELAARPLIDTGILRSVVGVWV